VDYPRVILVKLVKKAMPVVQNAPVVTLVNQVLVMGAHAKNARRVNLVRPTITTLLLVHPATQDIIKKTLVKLPVYHAYQERMQMKPVPQVVKNVAKGNTNVWLAMIPVWVVN
jgi:hypothetical protein